MSSELIIFGRKINRNHFGAGLIFLGLLSTALLITVIVQATNHKKNNNDNGSSDVNQYCQNRGCLSAATHQLRSLDKAASADRCTDFYKYACGVWQQTHPIESFETERTVLGDIINRRNADIERLLDSPVSRGSPISWEWKVKTYYTECVDDYARNGDSGKAMVDLIKDNDTIDGWFLFDNSAEGASQEFLLKTQTVPKQMSHIHGDLGASVIFGLGVKFDDTNSNAKRLEVYPSGLTLEVNDYIGIDDNANRRRSAYKAYMLDILTALAQDDEIKDGNLFDRIYTIIDDIMDIETRLAISRQRSIDNGDRPVSITFKAMSDRYSFDFVELMTHELGDPTLVSGVTLVYLANQMYFDDAFELLAKNDDPEYARRIHNYMRWRLVQSYIEDLSYSYIHAYRVFRDKYYNYAIHATNEAYCTREVERRFPLAIQRLYTMDSPARMDTIETVQKLFDALKTAFINYVNAKATWMTDEITKRVAREKIDALTVAIGYASIASNDSRLDEYYARFAVSDKSHLENAYSYHQFRSWAIGNSLQNPGQLDHWDFFETRTNRLYDYIAIFNRLFVIASVMNEPLVNTEWPWAMNMGSLGVLLAEKLFSSIDGPEGRVYSATGTLIPDWWSVQTANAYNKSRQCITDYYVREIKTLSFNIYGIEVLVQLAGEPFSPTTLRHIGALRFAYMAFKDKDDLKSLTMPATNLTSEQTFFLAYAQTQCYQRADLLQILRTQLGVYDERLALNTALLHMPEFASAFKCEPRDDTCF
ncbi:unnamed protein product [Rotaria socialis]|uniref:Uncharacterized protein n=1 Tax=Rotaria socialis TaxID=392032 RepID=A0A819VVM1_9BILA|nr:unnamed protein product [Rotaria socialis]CAF3620976.1 unnamed protein product [Rotaria socialis]CAF4115807.1 unnamed protein product [Rotaria socialis]CAF4241464.1 unnamed protein product [Rotaria socialis]